MSQLQTIVHVSNFGLVALPGSPKFLTGASPGTMACMDFHLKMKTQNYWFETEFFILFYFIFVGVCVCVWGKAQPQIQPRCSWQQCWAVLWSFKESSVLLFNISDIKESPVPVLWKIFRIKELSIPVVSKNLREWMVFMKEPAKNWWFFGQFFDCLNNLRTTIIHQKTIYLKILRTGR